MELYFDWIKPTETNRVAILHVLRRALRGDHAINHLFGGASRQVDAKLRIYDEGDLTPGMLPHVLLA